MIVYLDFYLFIFFLMLLKNFIRVSFKNSTNQQKSQLFSFYESGFEPLFLENTICVFMLVVFFISLLWSYLVVLIIFLL